jgi:hypothetical protein
MYWNYRMIDLSHENGGEPWIEIHEVMYEDDDTLMGYCEASLGCEDVEGMKQNLEWMMLALDKPVLKISAAGHLEEPPCQ